MLRHCNNQEKEIFFAVLLSVQAQGMLGNLSGEALNDLDELARALIKRFFPPNLQTELYGVQLLERRKKAT